MGINKLIQNIMKSLEGKEQEQDGIVKMSLGNLDSLGIRIVGIDAKLYLYQCLGNEQKMIINLLTMIKKIVGNGLLPLFIFDGKLNENSKESLSYSLRKRLLEKRKKIKSGNRNDLSIMKKVQELKLRNPEISLIDFENELNGLLTEFERTIVSQKRITELYELEDDKVSEKLRSYEKSSWNVNSKHIKICCAILRLLEIPYVFSEAEADPLLANLCKLNIIQAVISEDTDMLAYGTPIVIRDFKFNSDEITVYRTSNLLVNLGLTYEQFVDWCILLGTDYNHCVKNLDSERSFLERLKVEGNIEVIFHDFFEKTGKAIIQCIPYIEIHQIFNQEISEEDITSVTNLLRYSNLEYQVDKMRKKLPYDMIVEQILEDVEVSD